MRVAIGLYMLCSSAADRTVANLFGVGRSTVNVMYRQFCKAVFSVLESDWVKRITAEEMARYIQEFELSAVSVKVLEPSVDATFPFPDYHNCKGWYSIILLALVDHKYHFRFLATGQTLREVSFNFLVGRSTACCVVSTVCQALWNVLRPLYITHPRAADDWLKVAAEFEEVWNMPHCVGAIDGKHVNIECLPNSGSSDRNYKGTFSKCLLAVCDAHYRREFLHIEMGNCGSESDGGIFSRSKQKSNILGGHLHLPPDRSLWHIKSVIQQVTVMEYQKKGSLNETGTHSAEAYERRVFNYRLSRARRIIENAFGILVQRWRILRRPFKAKEANINRYVGACIVLHNFLLKESAVFSAMYCPAGSTDSEDWEGRLSIGSWRNDDHPTGSVLTVQRHTRCNATRYAKLVREKLAHHFVTAGLHQTEQLPNRHPAMQFEEQGAPSGDPSKKLEGVRAHGPFFAAIAQRGFEDSSSWQPNRDSRVCCKHFVNGEKSTIESHPGYVPTIFPTVYKKRSTSSTAQLARFNRWKQRHSGSSASLATPASADSPGPASPYTAETGAIGTSSLTTVDLATSTDLLYERSSTEGLDLLSTVAAELCTAVKSVVSS
ncbi:hypothetical protein HPB49_000720 [Dermacentor silvarum]|uniref:Uncharacterized protein n=1 Tax=Dermacentor silvarum TaxID=543639 RepID=A0ACB8D9K4_DERSI|nr:hypothetical protein HPB49_000720 [Dermacentor silvarum]